MSNQDRPRRQRPTRLDDAERARLRAELRRLEQLRAQVALKTPVPAPASEPARPAPVQVDRSEPPPPIPAAAQSEMEVVAAANVAPPTRETGTPRETRVIDYWATMNAMTLNERTLDDNLVIAATRTHPAHAEFDVLRTRLLQAMKENGWSRVAVTSPTSGCGKSFTAVNLAVALSRYEGCRTVLMDLDLRRPGLADCLGVAHAPSAGDFFRGQIPLESWLQRVAPNRLNIGPNLAFGLNSTPEDFPAELLQSGRSKQQLDRLMAELAPDVVVYDLPPALSHDDVIAFRPHFDCVLMVVGGGMTRAAEVRESIRRIGDDKPIIGIVLNKAELAA